MAAAATQADRAWMRQAIDLSKLCPPAASAYSVGAIIVGSDGETDAHVHAEESALAKLAGDVPLTEATVYSTLEPCSLRRSRPRTC